MLYNVDEFSQQCCNVFYSNSSMEIYFNLNNYNILQEAAVIRGRQITNPAERHYSAAGIPGYQRQFMLRIVQYYGFPTPASPVLHQEKA